MFTRSDDYMTRIFFESLDNNVILDAHVKIVSVGGKLKAYCEETKTYLQFPRAIREKGKEFLADVYMAKALGAAQPYYRTYKGSIRYNDEVVA